MIFVQFEAIPSQATAARENAAGAYVNCWVNTYSTSEAEALARRWIAEEGWSVISIEQGNYAFHKPKKKQRRRYAKPAATGTYAYEMAPVETRKRKAAKTEERVERKRKGRE